MTHLPLTLGEHTTSVGPVTFTRIGKGGKWAFDADGCQWSVATGVHGKHFKNPIWNITGRVEPDRPDPNWIFSADAAPKPPKAPREVAGFDVQMREVREIAIEADMARVTAARDEAVALLRDYRGAMNYEEWGDWRTAFLAKIGGK